MKGTNLVNLHLHPHFVDHWCYFVCSHPVGYPHLAGHLDSLPLHPLPLHPLLLPVLLSPQVVFLKIPSASSAQLWPPSAWSQIPPHLDDQEDNSGIFVQVQQYLHTWH